MKFSCTRDNLAQALSVVSRITSKNVQLPILNNVLMKTDGKILKFFSTNLEMSVSTLVRGHVQDEGAFTVPSKLFADYVNLLPNDRVDMELSEEETLRLNCLNHETKIKGASANDFPFVPKTNVNSKFRTNVKDTRVAMEEVIFAASSNETRPEISGVLFNLVPAPGAQGKLILAATDSYRLAESTVGLHGEGEAIKVIVPARTAAELLRILGMKRDDLTAGESLEISISESQIVFTYDNIELISRLIEGRYPEYTQIIPDNFATEMVIEKDELASAVRGAALFSKSGLYDVTLSGGNGELIISSADNQIGENKSKIKAEFKGKENKTTLNYRYLLDGLSRISGSKILFRIVDGTSPCVITPADSLPDGHKYLYIVMPIKQ